MIPVKKILKKLVILLIPICLLQAHSSAQGAYIAPGLSRVGKSDCQHRGGIDIHAVFFKFPNQFPDRDGSKTKSQTKQYSVSHADIQDIPYNVLENEYISCATLHNFKLYNKIPASATKSVVINNLSTFYDIPILGKRLDMGGIPGMAFYLQQRCILRVEPLRPRALDIRVSGYIILNLFQYGS